MKKKNTDKESWGYGSVSYEDCWNLHIKLAGIIAEHLHAFLNAEKYSTGRGFPGQLLDKCGGDDDKAMNMWLNIIRKMLYAFENYRMYKYPYEAESKDIIIDNDKVKEGMQLFVEYYDNLWI